MTLGPSQSFHTTGFDVSVSALFRPVCARTMRNCRIQNVCEEHSHIHVLDARCLISAQAGRRRRKMTQLHPVFNECTRSHLRCRKRQRRDSLRVASNRCPTLAAIKSDEHEVSKILSRIKKALERTDSRIRTRASRWRTASAPWYLTT